MVGHRPLQSVADRSRFPVEDRLHDLLSPLFVKYGVVSFRSCKLRQFAVEVFPMSVLFTLPVRLPRYMRPSVEQIVLLAKIFSYVMQAIREA